MNEITIDDETHKIIADFTDTGEDGIKSRYFIIIFSYSSQRYRLSDNLMMETKESSDEDGEYYSSHYPHLVTAWMP